MNANPKDSPLLKRLAAGHVLIFDGAMGTSTHALDLPIEAFCGCENCPEVLLTTVPDQIERIHATFLEAGCDVVETNTFGGARHTLAEFDLQDRCRELNRIAAQVARRAADRFSTPDHPRFVAGSIGPGTKLITLRQISYEAMLDSYREQARGLLDGGVDLLTIETCQDILQVKTAVHACRLAFEDVARRVPLMVSITMETTGTMLVGADDAAALTALEAFPEIDIIGLNCATGPQEMSEHVRYLAANCTRFLSVLPNAGLPQVVNGQAHFPLSPGELARWLREFVEVDGVNVIGGCCGTTPAHIAELVKTCGPLRPRPRTPRFEPASSSIYSAMPHRQDNSFLIVGERCNTNGSKKFKDAVAAGDLDTLIEIGIDQVKHEGAHVLDVCVDYVGRDGVADMKWLMDRFSREVQAPLMLDSTEPPVLEAGLQLAGGKCIINSVNLEDGEGRLDRIAALCKQYGAAVVALTIDEDPKEAMAKTKRRKVEIAERLYDLLVNRHGIAPEDIFFDLLTFPISTGNREDRRLALETLEGIEEVMKRMPRCQTILGVSNVSFGLVPAARVVLNSAFLHEARQRGLSAAIVHPGKIVPENKISEQRWQAALDLIYDRGEDGAALEHFIGLFSKDERIGERQKLDDLPVEERLTQRIIDGQRQGIDADLDEAMKKYKPLEIINTFLLDGMKVVGDLFGAGKMQLPFVLKSAETMKSAVAHLEPHMERVGGQSRGKMVLATVRGDVHDIGKNLVDIIVSNNGFTVFNLGIKQPVQAMIDAFKEHGAQAIGMSGLLVKSTIVMKENLEVLNEQGIDVPIVLGGAALTRRYVEDDLRKIYKGPVFYAADAFDGLHLMKEICEGGHRRPAGAAAGTNPDRQGGGNDDRLSQPLVANAREAEAVATRDRQQLTLELEQRYGLREIPEDDETPAEEGALSESNVPATPTAKKSDITHKHEPLTPPFWGARVLQKIELRAALGYINETMLFQVQWGFRKKGRKPAEWKRYVDQEIRPHYRELVERCERENILECQAIYGFWPCNSDGDDLVIYDPSGFEDAAHAGSHSAAPPQDGGLATQPRIRNADSRTEIARFTFPRQRKAPWWCLSDFWRPAPSVQGGSGVSPQGGSGVSPDYDVVAFQIVTAGQRVSEVAREWFAANDYQRYLFLHGLGVETAEALAEYIHKQIRRDLGVADSDQRDLQKLFKQGYQGSRFSFGYPACPNLEDQVQLMKLLQAERIGVTLSDEFQLEPEQSTSAIVTIHPEARYFNVR